MQLSLFPQTNTRPESAVACKNHAFQRVCFQINPSVAVLSGNSPLFPLSVLQKTIVLFVSKCLPSVSLYIKECVWKYTLRLNRSLFFKYLSSISLTHGIMKRFWIFISFFEVLNCFLRSQPHWMYHEGQEIVHFLYFGKMSSMDVMREAFLHDLHQKTGVRYP